MKTHVLSLHASLVLIAVLALFSTSLYAQNNKKTVKPEVTSITSVTTRGAMEVFIEYGKESSVKLVYDEEISSYLTYQQKGENFQITLKPKLKNIKVDALKVYITLPKLSAISLNSATSAIISSTVEFDTQLKIDLSGASNLKMDTCTTKDLFMELSGASSVTGHFKTSMMSVSLSGSSTLTSSIQSTTLFTDISGASSIDVNGACDKITLNVSGASRFKGQLFSANKAQVSISGASSAKCIVNESLQGNVSGASSMYYGGEPSLNGIEVSSAAKLKKL